MVKKKKKAASKKAARPAPEKAKRAYPMRPTPSRRVVNPAFDLPKLRPVARAGARESEKVEISEDSMEHAVTVLMDYIDSHPLATPSVEQKVTVDFYSRIAGSCAERASLIRSEMRAAAKAAEKKDADDSDDSEDDTED